MYAERRKFYEEWEKERDSKVLVYVTGDRQGLEAIVHREVIDHLLLHLDRIGDTKKISFFLYTTGGDIIAAWSIANLIRQFCDSFEVVVPFKAHSAGTIICLGADSIMMTKQATLGPIDPSVNGPLNPTIQGSNVRIPVSTEAIKGFLDFAREEAGIKEPELLKEVFLKLCDSVHPLVLGNVYRSMGQIKMLARRLLLRQIADDEKIEKILSFLCSESGSHDYTINRKEARDELGLKIEKPNDDQYNRIMAIYSNIASELQFGVPCNFEAMLGTNPQIQYNHVQALIESFDGGCHLHENKGILTRQNVQVAPGVVQNGIQDRKSFVGWRYQDVI